MADIIEILFEHVDSEKLSGYLSEIGRESVLINYQVSVDDFQSRKINDFRDLINILNKYSEGSVYLNLGKFRLGALSIPKVGMQILKHPEGLDLSLDISYSDFQSIKSLSIVQNWADRVFNKLLAENYCCGYEPAIDEGTRFFTMNKLGPLSFRKESV